MHNLASDKRFYAKEEYFDLEESSQEKFEFENGEVFAMSGGSLPHNLIANNMNRRLLEALDEKDCIAVGSDMRTAIDAAQSYVYPDAQVICGKVEYAEGRNDIVKNPVMIVEVLSESTESYDRGKKSKKYQTLTSFKEYVLISLTEPLIETFVRQDANHWLYTLTEGMEATLYLASINATISLSDIYRKVEFMDE
jgi:Uma2 family endonuclease